jgi:hypothetical protein
VKKIEATKIHMARSPSEERWDRQMVKSLAENGGVVVKRG